MKTGPFCPHSDPVPQLLSDPIPAPPRGLSAGAVPCLRDRTWSWNTTWQLVASPPGCSVPEARCRGPAESGAGCVRVWAAGLTALLSPQRGSSGRSSGVTCGPAWRAKAATCSSTAPAGPARSPAGASRPPRCVGAPASWGPGGGAGSLGSTPGGAPPRALALQPPCPQLRRHLLRPALEGRLALHGAQASAPASPGAGRTRARLARPGEARAHGPPWGPASSPGGRAPWRRVASEEPGGWVPRSISVRAPGPRCCCSLSTRRGVSALMEPRLRCLFPKLLKRPAEPLTQTLCSGDRRPHFQGRGGSRGWQVGAAGSSSLHGADVRALGFQRQDSSASCLLTPSRRPCSRSRTSPSHSRHPPPRPPPPRGPWPLPPLCPSLSCQRAGSGPPRSCLLSAPGPGVRRVSSSALSWLRGGLGLETASPRGRGRGLCAGGGGAAGVGTDGGRHGSDAGLRPAPFPQERRAADRFSVPTAARPVLLRRCCRGGAGACSWFCV